MLWNYAWDLVKESQDTITTSGESYYRHPCSTTGRRFQPKDIPESSAIDSLKNQDNHPLLLQSWSGSCWAPKNGGWSTWWACKDCGLIWPGHTKFGTGCGYVPLRIAPEKEKEQEKLKKVAQADTSVSAILYIGWQYMTERLRPGRQGLDADMAVCGLREESAYAEPQVIGRPSCMDLAFSTPDRRLQQMLIVYGVLWSESTTKKGRRGFYGEMWRLSIGFSSTMKCSRRGSIIPSRDNYQPPRYFFGQS